MGESSNSANTLKDCDKDDTLAGMVKKASVELAELAELERKLIPLLNKIRAMQGKPAVIVPKSGDWWK